MVDRVEIEPAVSIVEVIGVGISHVDDDDERGIEIGGGDDGIS